MHHTAGRHERALAQQLGTSRNKAAANLMFAVDISGHTAKSVSWQHFGVSWQRFAMADLVMGNILIVLWTAG
jgi:hypothetical protein